MRCSPPESPLSEPGSSLPFVSVVVPTRNRAHLLVASLESLVLQSYPADRFEVVVVDDGSVDSTPEVVQRVAARSGPTVRHVPRAIGGVNAARNTGIAAACGDPICFVDDDQEMPPEWLSTMVDATLRHPEAGCVGGAVRLRFEAPAPPMCEMESWRWESEFDLGTEERVVDHVTGGNLALRRWALAAVGTFESSLSGWGDDAEWGLRLTRAGIPVVYVPSAWLWHRRTREQLRWGTLLRRRFRQGRESAAYARFSGERIRLWADVWPLPFYLAHAVRRRCFGALMEVARKLGRAWGALVIRRSPTRPTAPTRPAR